MLRIYVLTHVVYITYVMYRSTYLPALYCVYLYKHLSCSSASVIILTD